MNSKTYHIFFRNLANPLRIKIISELRRKDLPVGELSEKIGVEQSLISHSLSQLKNCDLVKVNQEGKKRIYSLNKKTILPILEIIDKHAKTYCKCKECGGCGK